MTFDQATLEIFRRRKPAALGSFRMKRCERRDSRDRRERVSHHAVHTRLARDRREPESGFDSHPEKTTVFQREFQARLDVGGLERTKGSQQRCRAVELRLERRRLVHRHEVFAENLEAGFLVFLVELVEVVGKMRARERKPLEEDQAMRNGFRSSAAQRLIPRKSLAIEVDRFAKMLAKALARLEGAAGNHHQGDDQKLSEFWTDLRFFHRTSRRHDTAFSREEQFKPRSKMKRPGHKAGSRFCRRDQSSQRDSNYVIATGSRQP